jgi:hypothetical protein
MRLEPISPIVREGAPEEEISAASGALPLLWEGSNISTSSGYNSPVHKLVALGPRRRNMPDLTTRIGRTAQSLKAGGVIWNQED